MAINELALSYLDSRVILAAWATACLWILFDASLVAVQLTHTEALLQAQYKRNETMHEQNVAFSLQILHNSDNHLLLCELRTKIALQTMRLKEHHQIAIASWLPNNDITRAKLRKTHSETFAKTQSS